MPAHTNREAVGAKLDQIESEIRRIGLWTDVAPSPAQFESRKAFFSDTMPFVPLSGNDWWVINRIVAVPPDLNGTEQVIGTFNTSTHAVAIYPLPSTWPANAFLGPMAFSSVDGYVYFADIFNGIIGRIPSGNPATSTMQGYGTTYNEHAGSSGTLIVDQTSGTLYFDSIIPLPNEFFSYLYGMTVLTPSAATWSSSEHAGIPAFKRPLTKKQLLQLFHHRRKFRGKGDAGLRFTHP